MKTVKLSFVIIAMFLTASLTFAKQNASKAIIRQVSEDMISVKAEICDLDQMRVEITNEDGDIVYSDPLTSNTGIAGKTYDFSDTRIGGYYVTVYCNDKIMETTVIGNGKVAKQNSYFLVLN
jgi:hypothetical protein